LNVRTAFLGVEATAGTNVHTVFGEGNIEVVWAVFLCFYGSV